MAVPAELARLIETFERNQETYRQGGFNETQLRREFIDPFFKALGWDVDNTRGHAEAYKDVIHEDAIRIGAAVKAPDYCFRIGGTRKFFVEAKAPSINIKDDPGPAYQLRRYAWSAKLPLSILTDFEEFAVYDCRIKPSPSDKPSKARVMYFRYTDYPQKWEEIASRFSCEGVLKGSFDKYAQTEKRKRGTAEVDAAFLAEIETWRESLARNIALRNPALNNRQLNYAVQITIDRIVFLRICEDRGIEPYGQLMALQNGHDVYQRLMGLFRKADDRYNSGLFHFEREKDRPEGPDELTPELVIDDKALKEILRSLYYPDSPYEFSVLPTEILGQVYEQFLGKVITLTAGHHARVEDKPEVKKAGGVFYTPAYIVDYIVEQTVGKLLEGRAVRYFKTKPPALDRPLRILDPACGSGSFLLGAYQKLLDWHRDYYTNNEPEKWAATKQPPICRDGRLGWKLTTAERKRILLDHIFGVDIDTQAVEVTKLSLLLKVLEGEKSLVLFHNERALPDLAANIKCGNSLIGPDFYKGQQSAMFDQEERYRVNVFDWRTEFSAIFREGGFDATIGNPPYVDIKALQESVVEYIFATFPSANNRINLFAAFLERALLLGKQSSLRIAMIVPTAILTQESYSSLRRRIISSYHVAAVVRLPNESFGVAAGDVKVDTVIIVVEAKSLTPCDIEVISYAGYARISRIEPSTAHVHAHVPCDRWATPEDFIWSLNTGSAADAILSKCERDAIPLEECAEFCLGLTPYDKYKGHTEAQIKGRVFHADSQKDDTFKPLLAGNNVSRYSVTWNGNQWISYGPWLGAPREQRFFTTKRILVKQIIDWTTKRIWATITDQELYNTQNAFNLLVKEGWSLEYLLGILNARLMTFYHRKKFLDEFKMRFQKILIKDCRRFPIRRVNLSDRSNRSRHDRIVQLVETMLHSQKELGTARTPNERPSLQRYIAATDREIDQLVYELYGLTDEEIKIVEEATQ